MKGQTNGAAAKFQNGPFPVATKWLIVPLSGDQRMTDDQSTDVPLTRHPRGIAILALGFLFTALSALLIVAAGTLLPDAAGKTSVLWPLASFFGMGFAFMYYWPVTLSLVARAAPARHSASLMSAVYASLFVGTVLMGWVGSFYDQMDPTRFWLLDGSFALAGAIATFALRRPINAALAAN